MIDETQLIKVMIECQLCGNEYVIQARPVDLKAFEQGARMSEVLHYLSEEEREFFYSGMCVMCFLSVTNCKNIAMC